MFTNWVGAELKTNLRIKGTSATPELEGQMETLSGWFGFRNRRFDINSGTLHFRPGQNEPVLEMTTMLETVRAFEGVHRLLETRHELDRQAIDRMIRTSG